MHEVPHRRIVSVTLVTFLASCGGRTAFDEYQTNGGGDSQSMEDDNELIFEEVAQGGDGDGNEPDGSGGVPTGVGDPPTGGDGEIPGPGPNPPDPVDPPTPDPPLTNPCPSGQSYCDGACILPESNDDYCGADAGCDGFAMCHAPATCMAGVCVTTCVDPMVGCGAECVDRSSDTQNCGECGATCLAGQSCNEGECSDVSRSWTPLIDLGESVGYVYFTPSVAIDEAGNAIVIWRGSPGIFTARYDATEEEWGEIRTLPISDLGVDPEVAFTSEGRAVAAYVSYTGTTGRALVAFAEADGSWGEPMVIDNDPYSDNYVDLSVNATGGILVVGAHGNANKAHTFDQETGTWSSRGLGNNDHSQNQLLRSYLGDDGTAGAFWLGVQNYKMGMYTAFYSGQFWTPRNPVGVPINVGGDIDTDGAGRTVVVWPQMVFNEQDWPEVLARVDGGEAEPIAERPGRNPWIARAQPGVVFAAWEDTNQIEGQRAIWAARLVDGEWEPPVELSAEIGGLSTIGVDIAATSSGRGLVTFKKWDEMEQLNRVWVSEYSPSDEAWKVPAPLPSSGTAYGPSVGAMNASGEGIVAWYARIEDEDRIVVTLLR